MSNLPYTIQCIIEQAGGQGLSGAFVYNGAKNLSYNHPKHDRDCECRPGKRSFVDEAGLLFSDVYLSFQVNGKRGEGWKQIVCYEPDDTYTVYLIRLANKKETAAGTISVVLDKRVNVGCDNLQQVLESMYDSAINQHNGGFINI